MNNRLAGAVRPAAGWHGKLPSLGDFATRRLDSDFVQVWDQWVSTGLAQLQSREANHWLDAYLASPTWRFVLSAGFLPSPLQNQVWAGVLMPSVDRVGRYYPLTLACALPQIPPSAPLQANLWSWLHRLQDVAIDALQDDWSIEALEAELARMGTPTPGMADEAGVIGPPAVEFFSACLAPNPVAPSGRCVWYSDADISEPRLITSHSLDESIVQLWASPI